MTVNEHLNGRHMVASGCPWNTIALRLVPLPLVYSSRPGGSPEAAPWPARLDWSRRATLLRAPGVSTVLLWPMGSSLGTRFSRKDGPA